MMPRDCEPGVQVCPRSDSGAGADAASSHAGASRFAWNWGLARCAERYEAEGKWYSAVDLHKLWNAEKKADPALSWWSDNSKCASRKRFAALTGRFVIS